MSERRETEDAFDAFFDQSEKVMEMARGRLTGDVVEEILLLAAMLAEVPDDLRQDCELDDYYNMVVAFALEIGYGSEVA